MTEATIRHPLDGIAPIARDGATLSPAPAVAAVLAFAPRGRAAEIATRLGWPVDPGVLLETPLGLVGMTAPDRWLVLSNTGPALCGAGEVADRLGGLADRVAAADSDVRVSDQGTGRAAIDLAGPRLADLLALGCRLDIPTLAPGRIAETPFGPIATTLIRPPGAPERVTLLATAGYARALWDALAEAAATL